MLSNPWRHPPGVPRCEPPRAEGTFFLPGGRRLGYAEFGDPTGPVVLWFHGTPGGRRQLPIVGRRAAEKLGLRVVLVERAGAGLSDAHRYERIGDWADDMAHVADMLGADRLGVAGLSGGGPYALSCAGMPALKDRVAAVAVLGGVRIPFCRQNTAYSDVGNLGMSVRTLGALVEKFGLHGQQLGEVAMGAVIKHSSDWNLGREAALSSGLSALTPGITLQRACGTSLDSIITVANRIAVGQIESGIGGGADTTSDVPIVYGRALRRRLLALADGKAPQSLAAWRALPLAWRAARG